MNYRHLDEPRDRLLSLHLTTREYGFFVACARLAKVELGPYIRTMAIRKSKRWLTGLREAAKAEGKEGPSEELGKGLHGNF